MSALLDSLAEGFEALPADRVEALGLGDARRAALRHGLAADLPSQRTESWKYTALRALGARRFQAGATSAAVDPALLADIPAPRLVFVNGRHDATLSHLPPHAGLSVRPLSSALDAASPAVRDALAGSHPRADQVFASLNDALAIEGAVVEVAAGTDGGLLHVVFVSRPAGDDLALHLRHVVRLGEGSRLHLVEHHLADGAHRHLGNHLTDIAIAADGELVHARLQDDDVGASLVARAEVVVAAAARYRRVDVELGAALSRGEIEVTLAGAGARCESGGILMADGRRHLDTRLAVTHAARDTACDLLWRGLASDRGRLAFLGAITIAAGADGSDARLSAKNLLLSQGAEVDAQPVLEIHADEVKAAHGATVGRLDETALFYLRSRGIPEHQARALLTRAFCLEALRPLGDDAVLGLLSTRLETRLLATEGIA